MQESDYRFAVVITAGGEVYGQVSWRPTTHGAWRVLRGFTAQTWGGGQPLSVVNLLEKTLELATARVEEDHDEDDQPPWV